MQAWLTNFENILLIQLLTILLKLCEFDGTPQYIGMHSFINKTTILRFIDNIFSPGYINYLLVFYTNIFYCKFRTFDQNIYFVRRPIP
jgi:hypothetical protein